MQDGMTTRDKLTYAASGLMLVLVAAIIAYLTAIQVPTGNEKAIMLLLGVIAGAASAAIPNLFGARDSETMQLKDRVRALESHVAVLEAQNKTIKEAHDRITEMLVTRIDIGAILPEHKLA